MTSDLRIHRLAPLEPRSTILAAGSHGDPAGADAVPTVTSPIEAYLDQLYGRCASLHEGTVATYIPELAKADPNWFGCCLVTTDGHLYAVGDAEVPFTIQSISKPFVYATALADRGREGVLAKIGVEPTGDAFNAISLHPLTGQPLNPMINAGAIATAALVAGQTPADQWRRILDSFARFAGHEVTIDGAVYLSESETGFRNRAIGFMLRNFGILEGDPAPIVENYFKQCSIAVTCRDLGVMAATLANGGVNPVTGERALRQEHVESVLSVMASCGMYDYAGEWLYHVGMPAKSGVTGGILAVLPGRLGIGVFSPPLDDKGNSVRGIQVCRQLSRDFALHPFTVSGGLRLVINRRYSAAQVSSNRIRSHSASALLGALGESIQVYELQGELTFETTEVVLRALVESSEQIDFVLLDLKRVTSLNASACKLLYEILIALARRGKRLIFSHVQSHPALAQFVEPRLSPRDQAEFRVFEDNDMALEWCENQLLARRSQSHAEAVAVSLEDFDLFVGLSAAEIDVVTPTLELGSYQQGDVILSMGDQAGDAFFFLVKGQVSVTIPLESGQPKRIATLSAGMTFGEMAVIEETTRSATVSADTPIQCYVMHLRDFDRLSELYPRIKIVILQNLARSLSQKLRKANTTIGVLAR